MEYHYRMMNTTKRKSPFLTTRSALSCPRSRAFGTAHYQYTMLNALFLKKSLNHGKVVILLVLKSSTYLIISVNISRQFITYAKQGSTERFHTNTLFPRKVRMDMIYTREKQFSEEIGVIKHKTMYQLSMKTWSSSIAYHKQMIVILQGTAQYANGYNIYEHRNRVNYSEGKLKYLKFEPMKTWDFS